MSLTIAIQMDPLESIDINTDSTFVLALEAQARGYTLYHYLPSELVFRDGFVYARARPFEVFPKKKNVFTVGTEELLELSLFDIILMRQDPPFDLSYITATHLLEHVHPKTLVVNDPINVRNSPEKLLVTHFDGLLPPTLITSDLKEITAFREKYKDLIIKPIFGNGGVDVFHIGPEDENLNALLSMFAEKYNEPIILQQYIPEVRVGDKRIILVDGKPVGAVLRIPPLGDARANFHAGGTAKKTKLTKREIEICEIIGPTLSERGLIFVGIDVIGNYLTEINVTSPTGIQEINALDGSNLEKNVWNAIEMHYNKNF